MQKTSATRQTLLGTIWGYEAYRTHYQKHWDVPEWFKNEAAGLIDGAKDALGDLFIVSLNRELDPVDLECLTALSDVMSALWCSSLVAWGPATADDPDLAGAAIVARTGDWFAFPPKDQNFFAKNSVVIARTPDQGRPTVAIGFSGDLSCISCMNDVGVTLLRLTSNHNIPPWRADFSSKSIPLNVTMRESLEQDDPDSDGSFTVDDTHLVLSSSHRSTAYNVVTIGPDSATREPFIHEINHEFSVLRYEEDNIALPTGTVAATQHMRKMYEPDSCDRYSRMAKLLTHWEGKVNKEKMWDITKYVRVEIPLIVRTAHAMVIVPETRSIAVAFSDDNLSAPMKTPVWLQWEDLFDESSADDDDDDNNDTDSSDDDDDDAANGGDDEDEGSCCG